jgi:HPt (histidine-containing phosphotransfer) domain-containing protein
VLLLIFIAYTQKTRGFFLMNQQDTLRELHELMGEQYPAIIRTFINKADDLMSRLDGEVNEDFVREVHSLKSSSRYLGAAEMGMAAERLEGAAKMKSQEVAGLVQALKKNWQAVRAVYEGELKKFF